MISFTQLQYPPKYIFLALLLLVSAGPTNLFIIKLVSDSQMPRQVSGVGWVSMRISYADRANCFRGVWVNGAHVFDELLASQVPQLAVRASEGGPVLLHFTQIGLEFLSWAICRFFFRAFVVVFKLFERKNLSTLRAFDFSVFLHPSPLQIVFHLIGLEVFSTHWARKLTISQGFKTSSFGNINLVDAHLTKLVLASFQCGQAYIIIRYLVANGTSVFIAPVKRLKLLLNVLWWNLPGFNSIYTSLLFQFDRFDLIIVE